MKKIREQYRLATEFMFREVGIYFWMVAMAFLFLSIFTWFLFSRNPQISQELIGGLVSKFEDIAPQGEISYLLLFWNNFRAAVLGLVAGLIPFLFLPFLGVASNAAVLGLVASVSTEVPAWQMILLGILPHGIFELTAVFLSYAMGVMLCWEWSKKIVGRNRNQSIKELLFRSFRVLLLIVLPLLLVAAAVETWITPLLLNIVYPS